MQQTFSHIDLDLPDTGVMSIAVISDTHSEFHPESLPLIRAADPDIILHAGDIGDRDVLDPFEEIAPTYAVRGNIDTAQTDPDVIRINIRNDAEYEVRIVMTHIALWGPKLRKDAKLLAARHRAHLVICGHSHVPFLGQEGRTVVFNPGSIGPRRNPLPICFGLMKLGPGISQIRHIDCESGNTWLPPMPG